MIGARVLVVDDEPQIHRFLRPALEAAGYAVERADTAAEGLRLAASRAPDVVLLDLGLPDLDGQDALLRLRAFSLVPVIVLSARDREAEKVAALDAGADDYVEKPFGVGELLARIRAVLRRGRGIVEEPSSARVRRLRFASWVLDTARHELKAPDGAVVEISGAEYAVLLAFLEHPQRVMTRDRILELSRNRIGEVFDRSVDVLVSRLRRKLGAPEEASEMIKTVRGAGYLFAADVSRE